MDWLQLLCNEKPQKSPGSMYTCLVPSSCQSFLVSISAPDIWCFGYLWVLSLDQQYSIEDSNLRKPLVTYRIWLHFRQVPFPWLADISFNMNPLLWEVCDIQYVVRYEIVWSSYSGQIDLRSAPHNIQDVPDGFATVETTWICDRAFGIPNDLSKSTSSFLLTGKSIMSCRNRTWPWIRICVKMYQISHPCEPWCLELTIW